MAEALRALDFDVESKDPEVDWVIRRAGEAYAIEAKRLSPFRGERLGEVVADGVLRVQRYARQRRLSPAVALLVPNLREARASLAKYMQSYAPGVSWLLVDEQGNRDWHPIGSPRAKREAGAAQSTRGRASAKRDIFSPGFQWLMKLVLMSGADRRYWGGPENMPANLTGLARAGGASQPYASMFHKACAELGLARIVDDHWSVSDPLSLLDQWASAARVKERTLNVRTRWATGDDVLDAVEKKLRVATFRYAVGSVAGCRLLGLERSNARHARLYVDNLEQAMSQLELVREDEPTSLELVLPRAYDSVLSPRVSVKGLWAVDALQAYLDVRFLAARGAEQARYIYDKVLLRHFKLRRWA